MQVETLACRGPHRPSTILLMSRLPRALAMEAQS
jgi:hypothetical protein